MIRIVVLFLVMSCRRENETPVCMNFADFWMGIPEDTILTCGEFVNDVNTCIGNGELYICVWDTRRHRDIRYNRVACAKITNNIAEKSVAAR